MVSVSMERMLGAFCEYKSPVADAAGTYPVAVRLVITGAINVSLPCK
jgi:hypothetical protein